MKAVTDSASNEGRHTLIILLVNQNKTWHVDELYTNEHKQKCMEVQSCTIRGLDCDSVFEEALYNPCERKKNGMVGTFDKK